MVLLLKTMKDFLVAVYRVRKGKLQNIGKTRGRYCVLQGHRVITTGDQNAGTVDNSYSWALG